MRRICAVTERRADYSKLKAVLRRIQQSPEFELRLIVAGHHLVPGLGNTLELIEQDGFPIAARVPIFSDQGDDTGAEMARALGKALLGMTEALERLQPDLVLVGFDLGAHLAAAIAGAHMNIPVAHVEAGEVTGSIDEPLRHAITRFAHIHFAASAVGAERLIRMGENPRYVFHTGCPSLDIILSLEPVPPQELARQFGLDPAQPLILVVQHPVTTEAEASTEQVMKTLAAVMRTGMQAILIYPNIDAGGRRIIKAIESSRVQSYKNLPFETFVSLMRRASVIVGNSSAGIVEAPSLKLPAVNIGTRQQGRARAENVIDVGYDSEEIYQAITRAIHDQEFRSRAAACRNPYGDGQASWRIVEVLETVDLSDRSLIQKRLTY